MPHFTDAHGVEISYAVWAVENPRAVVQIAHGIGEHGRRYGGLAAALNAAGYSVVAGDHRGHGETGLTQYGGDVSKLGRLGPGGLRAAIADVHQLSTILRAENPGVPLVILGHSLGSLMVQILLNTHAADYDAAVLTGTAYRMVGSMTSGNLNRRHRHLGTTGHEWLSRDVEVHHAFEADSLTFHARVLALFGVADTLRLLGRPARNLPAGLPLLIMIGSDDSLGGAKSVHRLAEAYRSRSGLTDVETVVFPDARHEVFNEINRDEVTGRLIHWLARVGGGLG